MVEYPTFDLIQNLVDKSESKELEEGVIKAFSQQLIVNIEANESISKSSSAKKVDKIKKSNFSSLGILKDNESASSKRKGPGSIMSQ